MTEPSEIKICCTCGNEIGKDAYHVEQEEDGLYYWHADCFKDKRDRVFNMVRMRALQPVVQAEAILADSINHPAHYTFGTLEVIEVIEDWQLGFCLGNAIKYIARAGRKDPATEIQDLKKAVWYLNRRIHQLEVQ